MGLLFLNALKGLKKKKVQMVGIIFCILLATGIYTAMSSALDRIEDRYHNYLREQNVEDFAFTPKIDYSKDYTVSEIEELKKNELKDIPENQMDIVNKYEMTIGISDFPNSDILYQYIDYIFNSNGANDKKLKEKVSPALEKYDFSYYKEISKVDTEDKKLYKAIPYDKNKNINIPYLVEGNMPENKDEITVLPSFAKNNNINIGDNYSIGDKEYKVVGFAYSPDHILPIISINSPIFSENNHNISYMTSSTFEEFPGIKETAYVGAFNDKDKILDFETLSDMFKNDENISLDALSAIRISRVNALELEIKTDRVFAKYFMYLLLAISVFVIIVITKKRIEDERLQIGVLKALGYNRIKIAISYLVYPIFGSIIGGAIGFFAGAFASGYLSNIYLSYFNMPIDGYRFNINYLLEDIFVPLIILSILAFLIAIFMLRKKPLKLLKEGSNLKVNFFSKFVTFVTKKLPFKTRFRYSLASRSLGKLLIVTLTSFCTGLLIVLVLIGLNMFSSMLDKTFDGMKLKNQVTYIGIMSGYSDTEDYIYTTNMTLEEVISSNGDSHKIERKKEGSEDIEDYTVNINGIDKELRLLEAKDKDGNNVYPKLVNDDDIIINQNIAKIADASVGDILVFKSGDKEFRYKLVAIDNSFMGGSAYVKRAPLAKEFENDEAAYNIKFTNDDKYSSMSNLSKEETEKIANIMSIEDLRENLENQMSSSNGAIYVVIVFASIMAFVIILIIANIVVEENKKTISLMKVMGYDDKNISSIVLNIYTPFIIIAYLLSIPAMKKLLEFIVSKLTGSMDFAIPIEFSFAKALIGLAGLLISYFIAIFISRRTLNKVPLSVALKRE